jgi:formylglycine-generating enzyme required for sulfatase activity
MGIVLVAVVIALATRGLLQREVGTSIKPLKETESTQSPNATISEHEPEAKPHIAVLHNDAQIDFVWIPPGTFTMGSPENEFGRNENELAHTVTLSKGFWMGKYEVTQLQWEGVMQSNPSRNVSPHNPVENVTWMDTQEFIQRLNRTEDGEYRLPTEAEWEYACRAGTTTAYYFGDDSSQLGDYAWFKDNSTTRHPVGQRLPNAWGLYDMLGNVWEWCNDCYGEFSAEPVTDPKGAPVGDRVSRGGSWFISADQCRSAKREGTRPNLAHISRGFRLVWTQN